MKIALVGTRGVPATHGGFETCVEEIGWRLVERGFRVTVYSKRQGKKAKLYRGMELVYVPRLPVRGFETLFASILAVLHSIVCERFNFHMVFDNANAPALVFYKLFQKAYSINTDGLGWKRDKWGYLARRYYRWSELACVRLSKNIVTDSAEMHKYYQKEYGADSTIIAYGANIPQKDNDSNVESVLEKYQIESKKYVLQVTRFEPENNPLLSLQAFNTLADGNLKIVIIGGNRTPTRYGEDMKIEAKKSNQIVLPGFIYDKRTLDAIWTNCLCYIHGNQIGGTNPALLQAMASGRPIIARDCVFNREVLDGHGYFYDKQIDSLKGQIEYLLQHLPEAEDMALHAFKRVVQLYNWDLVTEQYAAYFRSLVPVDRSGGR